MNHLKVNTVLTGLAIFVCSRLAFCQSVYDPGFRFTIENPVYEAGKGALILYDEYHNNPFTIKGQYRTFADVVRVDGYRIQAHREKLTDQALSGVAVFVTVNALNDFINWDLPNHPVYEDEEVELLYRWVHDEGGSLFLVVDHMPCPGAVSTLALRFGFNVINGFSQRIDGQPEIFSRSRGNLLANKITDREGYTIDSIRCWGGSGFIPPREAVVISILGEDYKLLLPVNTLSSRNRQTENIPQLSGLGIANGAVLQCGKGRICIFADGAPFTAQLQGINSEKKGMNHPDASYHLQFLRNIIHWLDNRY